MRLTLVFVTADIDFYFCWSDAVHLFFNSFELSMSFPFSCRQNQFADAYGMRPKDLGNIKVKCNYLSFRVREPLHTPQSVKMNLQMDFVCARAGLTKEVERFLFSFFRRHSFRVFFYFI